MCPNGVTCLSADDCFSDLQRCYKNQTKPVGQAKDRPHNLNEN